MHKNVVQIARGSGDISQTDTHTHTCSSQYFATSPASGSFNVVKMITFRRLLSTFLSTAH